MPVKTGFYSMDRTEKLTIADGTYNEAINGEIKLEKLFKKSSGDLKIIFGNQQVDIIIDRFR